MKAYILYLFFLVMILSGCNDVEKNQYISEVVSMSKDAKYTIKKSRQRNNFILKIQNERGLVVGEILDRNTQLSINWSNNSKVLMYQTPRNNNEGFNFVKYEIESKRKSIVASSWSQTAEPSIKFSFNDKYLAYISSTYAGDFIEVIEVETLNVVKRLYNILPKAEFFWDENISVIYYQDSKGLYSFNVNTGEVIFQISMTEFFPIESAITIENKILIAAKKLPSSGSLVRENNFSNFYLFDKKKLELAKIADTNLYKIKNISKSGKEILFEGIQNSTHKIFKIDYPGSNLIYSLPLKNPISKILSFDSSRVWFLEKNQTEFPKIKKIDLSSGAQDELLISDFKRLSGVEFIKKSLNSNERLFDLLYWKRPKEKNVIVEVHGGPALHDSGELNYFKYLILKTASYVSFNYPGSSGYNLYYELDTNLEIQVNAVKRVYEYLLEIGYKDDNIFWVGVSYGSKLLLEFLDQQDIKDPKIFLISPIQIKSQKCNKKVIFQGEEEDKYLSSVIEMENRLTCPKKYIIKKIENERHLFHSENSWDELVESILN